MKDFARMAITLFVVCGLAAGSLGFVNRATKERIAEQARIEKLDALKVVFPDATEFAETDPGKAWTALKDAETAGAAAPIIDRNQVIVSPSPQS